MIVTNERRPRVRNEGLELRYCFIGMHDFSEDGGIHSAGWLVGWLGVWWSFDASFAMISGWNIYVD